MFPRFSAQAVVALLLTAIVACDRAGRENVVAPALLLPRLARATSPVQRLALLDALSSLDPATLPPGSPDPVSAVRPLLAAPDSIVAAKAGDLLARWGDHGATRGLVRLLEAPDPVIRRSAAASLAALADPAAADALMRSSTDGDAAVRAQACAALAALGQHRVAAALRDRLGDSDDAVRAAAARGLGRLGSADDVPALLGLLGQADPGVVGAAAQALGDLGDQRAVTPLIAALGHGTQGVRCAAATALGRMGGHAAVEPLLRMLQSRDSMERLAALLALGTLRDPAAIDGVLAVAGDPEPRVAERVPYVLVRFYTPERFEVFVEHVQHPDAHARAAVALALGLVSERRAITHLTRALLDRAAPVRGSAAEALGLLGANEAQDALAQVARGEPDPAAREAATIGVALERINAPTLAARLTEALADDNPRVRIFAADALGLLDVQDAEPTVRRLAQYDVNTDARNAALLALVRLTGRSDL